MSILERFKVIASNASPQKAKVVAVAETDHYSPDVSVEGGLVNSLAGRGDTVLLEAHQAGRRLSRKDPDVREFGFKRGVRISGWEIDMEKYYLAILLNLKRTILAERTQAYATEALKHIDSGEMTDARRFLDKSHRTLEATKKIAEAGGKTSLRDRNQSLVTAIQQERQRYPRRRVFAIAGSRHLTPSTSPETIQGLQQDLFAVMQLQETTPSTFSESVSDAYAQQLYEEHLAQYKAIRQAKRARQQRKRFFFG